MKCLKEITVKTVFSKNPSFVKCPLEVVSYEQILGELWPSKYLKSPQIVCLLNMFEFAVPQIVFIMISYIA